MPSLFGNTPAQTSTTNRGLFGSTSILPTHSSQDTSNDSTSLSTAANNQTPAIKPFVWNASISSGQGFSKSSSAQSKIFANPPKPAASFSFATPPTKSFSATRGGETESR